MRVDDISFFYIITFDSIEIYGYFDILFRYIEIIMKITLHIKICCCLTPYNFEAEVIRYRTFCVLLQ